LHTETTKDQSKSSPLPTFPVFVSFDAVICCTDASEAHLVSVVLSLYLCNRVSMAGVIAKVWIYCTHRTAVI